MAKIVDDRAAELKRENAALRRQLDICHAELNQAREQQTATAEVLQVINSSPGDLAPVFNAILEKAHTLCGAAAGGLVEIEGEQYRAVAVHGKPRLAEWWIQQGWIHSDTGAFAPLRQGECIHLPDVTADDGGRRSEQYHRLIELSGARSLLVVPLRKDNALRGAITAFRQEVRPFTDREIALLQNFAAQAVIAMENARLLTETREALDQQTATAEVLQVINSSPGDLAPVFDAMLDKAMRLCQAAFGLLHTYDGERFRALAISGVSRATAEALQEWIPDPGSALERIVLGDRVVHIPDVVATEAYRSGVASRLKLVELTGARTALWVALRKDDAPVGAFVIYRKEVRPFSDKQIALLQNFAAQAVIAIENARLLTETREALEQQTATAEVLQVINSSPGDLAPVFDAMLEKAMRLSGAVYGSLTEYDGEHFRCVASHNLPEPLFELLSQPRRAAPNSPQERLLQGDRVVHIADMAEIWTSPDNQVARAAAEIGFTRTVLFVPLRKENTLLGYITAARREVRPFSDKQIALLQNFAAQAVIAMENARLLTETREALEQQTATAEVLQVINSSPGDLTPVFDAIVAKAMHLCDAAFGYMVGRKDGEAGHTLATREIPADYAEFRKRNPVRAGQAGTAARIRAGEPFVHTLDLKDDDLYRRGDPQRRAMVDLGGARTSLIVALKRGPDTVGTINLYRQEVRAFTDKQIALLQNFAAQAVIAMENARLLTETREALEQQTATAEVLQVINSSPGDLAPVFDAMLEKAMRLCETPFGALWTYDGEQFQPAAARGPDHLVEYLSARPLRPDSSGVGMLIRMVRGESVVHETDMSTEAAYHSGNPGRRAFVDLGGARTGIMVALRKDDCLLGAIQLYRQQVRPFSDKQVALLQNFAAQAVIAMENARLITETREALEQQTATAEVLQVINSSPGDLAPVFDSMLEKAVRLCDGVSGILWTFEGKQARLAASRNMLPAAVELLRQQGESGNHPMVQRVIAGDHLFQFDLTENEAYQSGQIAAAVAALIASGVRTVIWVALVKDGTAVGAFVISRQEVRPFSDKQIALLQNFAAQAVIAMENARLLTETREALAQQTATAEVLQVINSSPGDLTPVFDATLEKATRLCEAASGILWTYDGSRFRAKALHGVPAKLADAMLNNPSPKPIPTASLAAIVAGQNVVRDDDLTRVEGASRVVDIGGMRTGFLVALRKNEALLGAIRIFRREARPFSEKQVALLQNFAAQAVIAMENARLLGELHARTDDLQESLEYQTAISDVLKVISRSAFDLQTVLQTVVTTAVRLCRADSATIYRNEGGEYCWAAGHMLSPEYEEIERAVRIRPGTGTVVGRATMERRTIQILDAWTEPLYEAKDDARVGGVHTMIGVPLLRENAPIGVIGLARRRVEAFSEREIALVTTFADQAVIAIENARLIDELRDRTAELGRSVEELKMLGEVGRAVSSTLDLRSVLSAILSASLGVTMANAGAVFRYSRAERAFHLVEAVGWDEALSRSVSELHVAETESAMGRAIAARGPVELPDLAAATANPLREATLAAGFHSALIVPLVGAERVFGAITLMRHEAGEFPPETVRLMQTLASQSVLAIQNARLFREIADKSEQLALASQHKSQFLANMSHELRTPLNAILGYAELLVDGIYGVLPEKAQGVLERVQNNGKHLLALINDVLDLAKIEAGQLTLTLEDYLLPDVVRSVVVATEPLAAAKGLKFTATIEDNMPRARGDARRVSQVLLNLVGNAIKFTDQGEVEICAQSEKSQFVLTVRDTGPGIADADQERIFGEFQQIENTDTRKKGGTGLGLAISKRMVEMQGGMISVESVLGRGSTFRVVLPVQVEAMLEEAAE